MNGSKRVKQGEADLRNPIVEIAFKCNIQFPHFGKQGGERAWLFWLIIITK